MTTEKKANFVDASVVETEDGPVFCLRSSLSVFEEQLYKGVPCSVGCNTAGYPLNVLSNCPTRLNPENFSLPFSFSFEADGMTACRNMELVSFEKEEDGPSLHTIASFRSGVRELIVREHTLLDGTAMFTRYLEIENTGDKPVSLSHIVLHGGGIEEMNLCEESMTVRSNPGEIYSLGFFEDCEWGREGNFTVKNLSVGVTGVDCRFDADRFRHPAVFLMNNLTGDTYYVQVGWSAGVSFRFNYYSDSLGRVTRLSYSASLSGYGSSYNLAAGEKLITPGLHFCAVHGGVDKAVNEGISHIRKSVLNLPEADGSALLVGAGMGAEHDMSVETSKIFARQMRDMGAEVFIVDAGWACPPQKETQWFDHNGINRDDGDRYPAGIKELCDYCHSIGMKFAVWMEPERLGKLAPALSLHPEWIAVNLFGEKVCGVIDMTNPEAAAWVEAEISRIVEEFSLDLLRIDYNVSGKEVFTFSDSGECNALRHYNAVYSMYERLKKKYPGVIFENCAGGGGRTDLGMLRNFNHSWVSDNQKMPRSIQITNGMTMVLPPERVDRLFAGMGCHKQGELSAHMRNTMLTHMSLNVISPACLETNSEAMEFVRHSVSLYKEIIRPIIPVSVVYHHTPSLRDVEEKGFLALEIALPDKSVSVSAVFFPAGKVSGEIKYCPGGISPAEQYSVYLDNDRCEYISSGNELIRMGITIRPDSALSSELIIIRKISRA